MARKGDLIVVNPPRVGGPPREGEIIEVIEGDLRVQFRVRWNDGHETLFAPGAGAARIEPARAGKRIRSEGTVAKKSTARKPPAKASAMKKSRAKKSTATKTTAQKAPAKPATAKKSAAGKSTVRKVAARRAASGGPSGRQ